MCDIEQKLVPVRTGKELFTLAGPDAEICGWLINGRGYYITAKGGPCAVALDEWESYQKLRAQWLNAPLDLHNAPTISMLVVDSEEEAKRVAEERIFSATAPAAAPSPGAADLARIYASLQASLTEIQTLVTSARSTLSIEDYEDALAGASARLTLCQQCVTGLIQSRPTEEVKV